MIAAVAALSARETYRVNINDLGNPDAVPMAKAEYEKKRAEAAEHSQRKSGRRTILEARR